MELLVFKVKDEYLRIKNKDAELVSLNKASVYSISKAAEVHEICAALKAKYPDVIIRKLTVEEEEYVA